MLATSSVFVMFLSAIVFLHQRRRAVTNRWTESASPRLGRATSHKTNALPRDSAYFRGFRANPGGVSPRICDRWGACDDIPTDPRDLAPQPASAAAGILASRIVTTAPTARSAAVDP